MSPGSASERLARIARRKTTRLTHYGRKSGKPYQVTIWFLVDGPTVYLMTMDMKRQWTRNVQARPEVELEMGGESFRGRVQVVTSDADMRRVVELMKRKYFLSRPYLWVKGRPDGAFRVEVETAADVPRTA
jgi:deazaflavin-dependent oxidoreductase (nitroreductase family)